MSSLTRRIAPAALATAAIMGGIVSPSIASAAPAPAPIEVTVAQGKTATVELNTDKAFDTCKTYLRQRQIWTKNADWASLGGENGCTATFKPVKAEPGSYRFWFEGVTKDADGQTQLHKRLMVVNVEGDKTDGTNQGADTDVHNNTIDSGLSSEGNDKDGFFATIIEFFMSTFAGLFGLSGK